MNSNAPICQSCGMPMIKPEDFGTKTGGIKDNEYCVYCFLNGKFTLGDITLSEMIERLVPMAPQMGMTEAEARKSANENLPKLKRWKTKSAE